MLQIISLILIIIFAIAFFSWVLVGFAAIIILCLLAWACGIPITITMGKTVKKYRWFKEI